MFGLFLVFYVSKFKGYLKLRLCYHIQIDENQLNRFSDFI